MFGTSNSIERVVEMGCCGCFGFTKKPRRCLRPPVNHNLSQEFLLDEEEDMEHEDDGSYNGGATNTTNRDDEELQFRVKRSEEILKIRTQNGIICREFPVKETDKVIRTEVIIRETLSLFIVGEAFDMKFKCILSCDFVFFNKLFASVKSKGIKSII